MSAVGRGARLQIAVVGAGGEDPRLAALAEEVGREVARAGAVLVSGGRGGVMAAATRGAHAAGGITVGILPGVDAASTPPAAELDVAVFTGLGQARNVAVVLSASAVVAVGGGWGTLAEIALARKHGVPVVRLASWTLAAPDGAGLDVDRELPQAADAQEAVRLAVELADRRRLA